MSVPTSNKPLPANKPISSNKPSDPLGLEELENNGNGNSGNGNSGNGNGNAGNGNAGSDLVKELLKLQVQMKLYHWQTKKYARHKASDDFYGKSSDMIDRLVEAYQGSHNTVYLRNKNKNIAVNNIKDENIVDFLKTVRTFLLKQLPTYLDKNTNVDIFTIRDELVETINTAIYLFRQD